MRHGASHGYKWCTIWSTPPFPLCKASTQIVNESGPDTTNGTGIFAYIDPIFNHPHGTVNMPVPDRSCLGYASECTRTFCRTAFGASTMSSKTVRSRRPTNPASGRSKSLWVFAPCHPCHPCPVGEEDGFEPLSPCWRRHFLGLKTQCFLVAQHQWVLVWRSPQNLYIVFNYILGLR